MDRNSLRGPCCPRAPVATREGGVDRNAMDASSITIESGVATREGGVDRNIWNVV